MAEVEHTFVRIWTGDPAEAWAALWAAFEATGFRLSAPSHWAIHGELGSSVAMSARNLPISMDAVFTRTDDGVVTVHIHLADNFSVPFAGATVRRSIQQRFVEIERALDMGLSGTAHHSHPGPASPTTDIQPPPQNTPTPAPAIQPPPAVGESQSTSAFDAARLGEQMGSALEKLTAKTQETVAAVRRRGPTEPWQKVEAVTFVGPSGEATVDASRIQAFMSVSTMVERQPGALPENLAAQLADFVQRLLAMLDAAGTAEVSRVRHQVEPVDRPVLEFLEQQARMREQLPVRTLHHCKDCGHEKVSNPDYRKLMDRNRKMQALTGAAGLTVRGGSVSPFLLVGALFRLKKLDPDYVCPRCQGMESDDSITTFCPECGSQRSEAVLRSCSKCDHDLRTTIGPLDLWHPAAIEQG
jgi:hypothetical protein